MMNTNLITYDMENFLKKYTRFMTKDIYITNKLYENFLSQYNYLYEELEKNSILFRENIKYKKIINIKENKKNLLKLHNQKYLKKAILKYQPFFESLNYHKTLDYNKKAIILSDEENSIILNNKNNKELIVTKIKYLIDYKKIPEEKILIISEEIDEEIKKELIEKNLTKIGYNSMKYYRTNIINDKKIVNDKEKYSIIFEYLTKKLFPQKMKFKELYEAFPNNIYLNKDYKDFDTFKDYHNYIYKKVYLTSNLSLKKFNEKEIEKRKNYLRTINNIIMNSKEEVDIANFLYLNSISYTYKNKTFIIENNNKKSYISLLKKDDNNDNIYLEKKDLFGNSYIEKLIYELIKRRYPLELISDEEIYNKLKDTTINNYFFEFISKYLIPLLDYYDKNKTFDDIKLTEKQKNILKNIYKYYKSYLEDNNLLTEYQENKLIEKEINNYKYVIIINKWNITPKTKSLKIFTEFKEEIYLKENIKLLYDYKKYLINNSILSTKNTFTSLSEIKELTNDFKKEYIKEIEKTIIDTKKEINIYLYEDDKRLLINKNITKLCLEIIKNNKNYLIGVDNKKQIDNLILKNYFTKHNKNKLIDVNNNIIDYQEVINITTFHNNIILPFLIKDPYHEDLLSNNIDDIKITIYNTLNKCRDKLIILCPKSKKNNLKTFFKNIKNIKFYD